MTVRIDLNDGNSGSYTKDGWEGVTRIAIVDGLTASSVPQKQYQSAIAALQQAGANGAYIGQAHPHLSGLRLVRIQPEGIDSTTVKLRLDYESSSGGGSSSSSPTSMRNATIDFDSSGMQEEVFSDSKGLFTVSYTYPTDYTHDKTLAGKKITQGVAVSKYIPLITKTYTFTTNKDIESAAANYVCTMNSSPFSRLDRQQWLCTRVAGTKVFGVREQEAQVVFVGRPLGSWVNRLVFIDPITGHIPPDASPTNGISDPIRIYKERDFNSFPL